MAERLSPPAALPSMPRPVPTPWTTKPNRLGPIAVAPTLKSSALPPKYASIPCATVPDRSTSSEPITPSPPATSNDFPRPAPQRLPRPLPPLPTGGLQPLPCPPAYLGRLGTPHSPSLQSPPPPALPLSYVLDHRRPTGRHYPPGAENQAPGRDRGGSQIPNLRLRNPPD